jgi:hypothetical protein
MGGLESLQTWFSAVTDPQASLTPQQEKDLETLRHAFPDVSPDDIKGLLQDGFTPDEIRALLKAGFTHSQIQDIITRIRTAQRDPHGTDRLGLTVDQIRDLVNRVAAAVNSPHEGTQLEGKVARVLINDLVAFQHKVIDPATGLVIGDIDVETLMAIIEVTKRDERKRPQVLKENNNKLMNPKGKQVILYAPNYSYASDAQFQSHGIPIIRSLKNLFDYLRSS